MKHRKQVGFTLIELVIVITILGIVTVTAAPKFLNISSDARVAVLNGIAGSIKTINTIVNTKAIIQAVPDTGDDKNRTIATNLGSVDTWYKYPESVAENGKGLGIAELIELEGHNINIFNEDKSNAQCYSIKMGYNETTCYVKYTEACSTTVPAKVETVSSQC
ncbi:pilus assembly FimT family protein [Photobacterium leiognathi]|uniref:Prepilin-type cleavage/methylation domain-containing protein n=1 Tax=Photobacterium leiognathi TaxID=553611 RepID=A0A2T3MFE7_PHOLE|nr:prepilin-type N-terminal cleavage/methylation domain-containing protein [Photobacterium leiognathi]KJF97699.1 hypothetical protein UB34_11520 [Photobacterium leiognathi]PSV92687.1 prepilin-type cleavage/methylation domain-containing protein [Photobacterium leiognathi]